MQRTLRLGRLATFAYFLVNGFLMGMWIVHIPLVEERTGVSHALLGWLLLLLGAGAFAGMQLAGPLTDRLGPRKAVPFSAALFCATVITPGLATDATTLALAMLALGLGNGTLDVSMNTHAVRVEQAYRRPVMSAFHAMWSIGGVFAALLGALTLSRDWPAATTLTLSAIGALFLALLAAPALLARDRTPDDARSADNTRDSSDPRDSSDSSDARDSSDSSDARDPSDSSDTADLSSNKASSGAADRDAKGRRRTPRYIWALAALAFMLMLSEGVANDWSTLHLKHTLDAPAATAALAYGAFATTMTIGRLLTDRLAARFGPVAILRNGSVLAGAGLTLAALAPTAPLSLVGWAVMGAGLAGCVPQLFSAAGHVDPDAAGVNVARVAGLGYIGVLAGPAVIGPMTELVPLNLALLLPVVLCVIAAFAARALGDAIATPTQPAKSARPTAGSDDGPTEPASRTL